MIPREYVEVQALRVLGSQSVRAEGKSRESPAATTQFAVLDRFMGAA